MDKSRQRSTRQQINESFIVKSKKSWWREGIVILFTLMVWIYCVTVIYFFIDAIFLFNHEYPRLFKIAFKMTNYEIRGFFRIGVVLFILIYLLLWIWICYNRRKYGNLTRRKHPGLTTKEDLMKLDMIDESIYEKIQREKIIIFEKNPIRNEED